jgi:hypothetical protein
MITRRLTVLRKCRKGDFDLADPGDFECTEGPAISPELILRDNRLSLYCIDREAPRVLFVHTPVPLDPGSSAFLYQAQYKECESLVQVPLEVFHQLAQQIQLESERLVFVQSTGRCGSTLVSKVFAALGGVVSWSEPDIFTRLTNMRPADGSRDREVADLCESSVRLMCRPIPGGGATHHVLKFRSQVMELSDLLCERFPTAKHVFMYRNALTWLDSFCRSLLQSAPLDDADYNRGMEEALSRCHPVLAEYHQPDRPMSPACLWTLDWVSSMERYLDLCERKQPALALRFEDLKEDPEAVLHTLLEYTGLKPDDWRRVRAVIEQDSQGGTAIARNATEQAPQTPATYFEEAVRILATRPRLSGPAMRVPGTIP